MTKVGLFSIASAHCRDSTASSPGQAQAAHTHAAPTIYVVLRRIRATFFLIGEREVAAGPR